MTVGRTWFRSRRAKRKSSTERVAVRHYLSSWLNSGKRGDTIGVEREERGE